MSFKDRPSAQKQQIGALRLLILFLSFLRFCFTFCQMRMRCIFFLLLFLLTGTNLLAQEEIRYRGVVLDSIDKTPLEKATISLIRKSTDTTKKTANAKGQFSFTLTTDSAVLIIQHIGYAEKKMLLRFAQLNSTPDTIYLVPADKRLDDIIVKAKVPPIVVRGDTTEFNIDSAMFEPFDVVEDLVKRLPGLEIDAEGKMTFQGKPITRILVDGEDLFGGDPNFSMKKLPAGLVSKIQVMDTKTLEQLFNGTPTDGEDKTLNIKLKAGNKTFGSGDVTVGTSNQLGGNATISQFNEGKKIALTGTANTSNNLGFMKRRQGPTSSATNAGANYSNRWGRFRFNSSYGYDRSSNSNNSYRERTQLITADTSFFSRHRSFYDYANNGHRLNMGVNWFIDSSSTIDVNLAYNRGTSEGISQSSSVTLENGALRNESQNNSLTKGNNEGVTANLVWVKRLNRKGRRYTIGAKMNSSGNKTDQLSQSVNTYFKSGLPVSGDTLDRQTINNNQNKSYSFRVLYTEPITKELYFDASGEFEMNRSATDRSIYNLDSITKTSVYDSVYSAAIRSSTNTQTFTTSISYRKQNLNISAGIATVRQQAVRTLQKEDVLQDLLRYAPSLTAAYNIAKNKAIRASFSGNTIQPTIEQLQPIPDNSNPLYIRLGNPKLRTAFSQNYSAGYTANHFSDSSQKSFNANIGYSPTSNQIVNAVLFDEFRRQTSRFINANGVYSLRGNLSFSFGRRQDKKMKDWNASSAFNYGQQVYFQSNRQYYSRNYTTSASLGFSKRELVVRSARYGVTLSGSFGRNWTPADTKILNTTRLNIAPQVEVGSTLFDFLYTTASYKVWYNKIDYHSALRRNDEYSIHHINSDLRFQIKKNFWVNTTWFYQYNTRVLEGTPKGILNCNITATGQVMKGRGQLLFTAADLFAPGISLRRTVSENYIEDTQVDNLRNYFTLKFQYSFSKLERRGNVKTMSNIK